jgi:hypothetical protein
MEVNGKNTEKLTKIAKFGNYFFMVIGLLLEGRSSTSLK